MTTNINFFFILNFDPLSQFEVVNLLTLKPISVTNLAVFTFGVFTVIQSISAFSRSSKFLNICNYMIYNILRLVNVIISDNTNLLRKQYFSVLFFLFMFILISNFVGLLPYSWTITNSFVITFFLAFTHFFSINFTALWDKKWGFVTLFIPSGVPLLLTPLIFIIEVVSYFSRVFSLSIRLFANISSGHALLKILIGFSWSIVSCILNNSAVYQVIPLGIGFLLPWVIVTLIFFLEVLIAFLQSYVFVILLTIYINDVTSEH